MVYGFFKLFIVVCQKCFVGLEDYVVDALALHDHMHLLRPLLADPTMLKVNPCAACCTLTRYILKMCGQRNICVQLSCPFAKLPLNTCRSMVAERAVLTCELMPWPNIHLPCPALPYPALPCPTYLQLPSMFACTAVKPDTTCIFAQFDLLFYHQKLFLICLCITFSFCKFAHEYASHCSSALCISVVVTVVKAE